jgi:lysyl-tRNA synthetase class 2
MPASPLIAAALLAEGKRPLVFLLVGFICMFVFIRFNTRMIRAQKRWWFRGDIRPSGLHIHHSVFGIVAMFVVGIVIFALEPGGAWFEFLAFAFGAGAALMLDEFALILHLEDVYWEEAGRKSIDAVILGVTFAALFLTNIVPLGIGQVDDLAFLSRWVVFVVVAFNVVFVVICYLKSKLWLGTLGVFVPFVAMVGAYRLAKPNSPWAHGRYADDPGKLERAQRRDATFHQVWTRRRHRLWDLIGGRPHIRLPHQLEQHLRRHEHESPRPGAGDV